MNKFKNFCLKITVMITSIPCMYCLQFHPHVSSQFQYSTYPSIHPPSIYPSRETMVVSVFLIPCSLPSFLTDIRRLATFFPRRTGNFLCLVRHQPAKNYFFSTHGQRCTLLSNENVHTGKHQTDLLHQFIGKTEYK